MKLWRSMMALPQPLKGCLFAYFLAFGVAFVAIPAMSFAGRGQATAVVPWTMGALGASAVLLGLVLATDLRGSARAYASTLKDFKPMDVELQLHLRKTGVRPDLRGPVCPDGGLVRHRVHDLRIAARRELASS